MGATDQPVLITTVFKNLKSIDELYSLVFPSGKFEGQTYLQVVNENPNYIYNFYLKSAKALADGKPDPYPFVIEDLRNFETEALLTRIQLSTDSIVKNTLKLKGILL